MRTAIISDVHGNLEALHAVLRHVEGEHIDEIVCLGDTVGYGPEPNECCDLVREVCRTVVLGNHDEWTLRPPDMSSVPSSVWYSVEWTRGVVLDRNKEWFSGLPLMVHAAEKLFVHAAPLRPSEWAYITDAGSAARYFPLIGSSSCFVGHSHLPGEFRGPLKNVREDAEEQSSVGLIVNVGSVGQPRDGNPLACYCILDDSQSVEFQVRFARVEYDHALVAKKIIDSGVPEFFATRLASGR